MPHWTPPAGAVASAVIGKMSTWATSMRPARVTLRWMAPATVARTPVGSTSTTGSATETSISWPSSPGVVKGNSARSPPVPASRMTGAV